MEKQSLWSRQIELSRLEKQEERELRVGMSRL
jgi:hypothetical protein